MSVLEAAKSLAAGRDSVSRLVKAERRNAHHKTHAPQSPLVVDRASLEAYDRALWAGPLNARRRPRCKRSDVAVLQS